MSILMALSLQAQILPRYFDLQNGTVVDTDEMFVWVASSSRAMSREAADQYVRTLQTGEYSDWRLPTAKELHDLFDEQPCRALASQGTESIVCLPPNIEIQGPAVWTREGDADGAPAVVEFTTGELKRVESGSTAVVLAVRKSSYE